MTQEGPDAQAWTVRDAREATDARHGLATWLTAVDLPAEKIDELLVAVSELVVNGVEAGLAIGRVWVKVEAVCGADGVVVRVRNQGASYHPIAGPPYRMPPGDSLRGRGLVIVSELTASFEIEGQIGGTEARVTPTASSADIEGRGQGT